MDDKPVSITYGAVHHDYCEKSGYCKRCGSHKEYIRFENLLCVWATNSTAISHIRAATIEADKKIGDALKRLKELTGQEEPAS